MAIKNFPKTFQQELTLLINKHGVDARMNTPDFILSNWVVESMNIFYSHIEWRERMNNSKTFPKKNKFHSFDPIGAAKYVETMKDAARRKKQ
jgi:hypothetical protein